MPGAVYVQEDFRFRNDDGTLSTASWMDGDSTNNNNKNVHSGSTFRIRIVVQETSGKAVNNGVFELWASYKGGTYFQVTTTSSYIQLAKDANAIADHATTIQRIGDGTYTTGDCQGYNDGTVDNLTGNVDHNGNDEAELEFCLLMRAADVAHNDTIDLQVRVSGGTALSSYTYTPRANVIEETSQSGSFTADAAIARAIAADAYIAGQPRVGITQAFLSLPGVYGDSFTADAHLLSTHGVFPADAVVERTESGSVTSDALLQQYISSSLTCGSYIVGVNEPTWRVPSETWSMDVSLIGITADALIEQSTSDSVSADAVVFASQASSISADAFVEATLSDSLSADAYIVCVGKPTWVSPSDNTEMSDMPVLVFEIPSCAQDMHFRIELDTVDTFDSANYRKYESWVDQTNWEYHDGADWQPFPAGGVSPTYTGNQCRLTITEALGTGTWYRTVRGGLA